MPRVIATTPDWLAVDKPAGWLTIPGRAPGIPALSEWASGPAGGKAWVVHRLDRETSGVVLFARTAEAHRRANEWFRRHQARKTYECLAAGKPGAPVLRLDAPVEGAPSVTQVEVVERFGDAGFLARARPLTGRRHQIRIHLAEAGHPLWGDAAYGGPPRAERVALHASRLELPDGSVFEAPWPEDFAGWVRAAREGKPAP
jgi:23S rRNA-/tRNA-specific pseudouridylate synthase